ncbi:hypothetical protein [Streptomyces sp. NPDC058623]
MPRARLDIRPAATTCVTALSTTRADRQTLPDAGRTASCS